MLNWYLKGMTYLSIIVSDVTEQSNDELLEEPLIMIIMLGVVLSLYIVSKYFPEIHKWIIGEEKNNETVDEIMNITGYSYDSQQDIFYSTIDAWQRQVGYCRLYDEAAAPLGMIIDCEPIYFNYDNRRWLIEFWKGQYDLTTGCEIGVYSTDGPDLDISAVFNGTFYECASDEDILHMSCTLKKDRKIIFKREDKHWWVTGFKLGMYSEPYDLTMDITIELKDETMTNEFIQGLRRANYKGKEIVRRGNTVSIEYITPKTSQPYTRTMETDRTIQKKNKALCDSYNYYIENYDDIGERMEAIEAQAPELYDKISKMGRVRKFADIYKIIKRYMD